MKPSPFFMLALAFALPLGAFADVKTIGESPIPFEGPAGAIFQKLEGLFVTGVVPQFNPDRRYGFSGRCFTASSENAVKGAAYVVRGNDDSNGPLGCGLDIQTLWDDRLDYFDRLSVGEAVRAGAWRPASIRNGSLFVGIDSNATSSLRVNGAYYIEKIAGSDGRKPEYYCYYYRALTP